MAEFLMKMEDEQQPVVCASRRYICNFVGILWISFFSYFTIPLFLFSVVVHRLADANDSGYAAVVLHVLFAITCTTSAVVVAYRFSSFFDRGKHSFFFIFNIMASREDVIRQKVSRARAKFVTLAFVFMTI